mmetsp:Transcript_34848/g.53503  ORF Transcript_34848/g.53503 Transcript_34848/m.53503 type:complete len:129 (+) Transcript_34848:1022-1408(+)
MMNVMRDQMANRFETGEYRIDLKRKRTIKRILYKKKDIEPKDLITLNKLLDFEDRLQLDNMADLMAKRKVKRNLRFGQIGMSEDDLFKDMPKYGGGSEFIIYAPRSFIFSHRRTAKQRWDWAVLVLAI